MSWRSFRINKSPAFFKKAKQVKAMRNAFRLVRERQQGNMGKMFDIEERKGRLRRTREKCVGDEKLLNQAIYNLTQNGMKVFLATTKEEALSFIFQEVKGEKLIVKSKSNATKEIDLVKALELEGIQVVETDIGDRIIQLCGETPSHPTGPASHLSRYDIAQVLSKHFNQEIEPIPERLTEIVKKEVSTYLNEATIGIAGANAVTAEEGAIVLVHNEGNIIEVAMRPKKLLIITGIDKIYPNLEEAINMAKLQIFYATGSLITSFITILGGASQTADIEKKLIKGIHGPKEIVLVLLDNGRSQIVNSEYRELLYCIGCGECLLVCPAYNVYGNDFGSDINLGGRGVLYSKLSTKETVQDWTGLDLCLTCNKCYQNCPLSIDIPAMIQKLRLEYHKKLSLPQLAIPYDFINSHLKWLGRAIWLEVLFLISKMVTRE